MKCMTVSGTSSCVSRGYRSKRTRTAQVYLFKRGERLSYLMAYLATLKARVDHSHQPLTPDCGGGVVSRSGVTTAIGDI